MEGIRATPGGDIYVGGEAGQIYHIVGGKPVEVANTGGFMLGLAASAEGRIYAIDNTSKLVWRYDPADDARPLGARAAGQAVRRPQLGRVRCARQLLDPDRFGRRTKANGCIWVARPGGATEIWTTASAAFPNGC